jgi:hypothetical protein
LTPTQVANFVGKKNVFAPKHGQGGVLPTNKNRNQTDVLFTDENGSITPTMTKQKSGDLKTSCRCLFVQFLLFLQVFSPQLHTWGINDGIAAPFGIPLD